MALNGRIPDVPQTSSPGLSEFLQAVRREVLAIEDELTQLEADIQAEVDKPFTVRPYRQMLASGGILATDLGGVIQVGAAAGIVISFPNPVTNGWGYGQTVEIITYNNAFTIVGLPACSLINANTGTLLTPGTTQAVAGSNRLVATSGDTAAWWFEVAH